MSLVVCVVGRMCRRDTGMQVSFHKEPFIIGLFCGKWPMKIRHPRGLRHSVVKCVTGKVCCREAVSLVVFVVGIQGCKDAEDA